MPEQQYIPFGNEQIDYNAFITEAANNVYNYVDSLPWSKKRKLHFMDLYSEVMNDGIIGAKVGDNGIWAIEHNGPNKNFKEDPMWGWVASYLKDTMESIPTKRSVDEQNQAAEKARLDALPLFDNSTFTRLFLKLLYNTYFGGQSRSNVKQAWDELDPADEFGIRGIANRKEALASLLENFLSNFNKDEYKFEGGPFTNYDDLSIRIQDAINALRSDDLNDDNPALNRLGLNPRDYLDTGENNIVNYQGLQVLARDLRDIVELQQHSNELLQLNNLYSDIIISPDGIEGTNAQGLLLNYGSVLGNLNSFNGNLHLARSQAYNTVGNLIKNNGVSNWSDLLGMFKLFGDENQGYTNLLEDLSTEELNKFGNFPDYAVPGRLKKINGVDNYYYDTLAKKVIRPVGNGENTGLINESIQLSREPQADLQTPTENISDEQRILNARNQKVFDENGNFNWNGVDTARAAALLQDLVSTGVAFVPGGGTAASGILGVTSALTNLGADIADEGVTAGEVWQNLGANLAMAIVGMAPFGKLPKTAFRVARFLLKSLPIAVAVWQIGNLGTDLEFRDLLNNLNNPAKVTRGLWQKLAQLMSLIAGGGRGLSRRLNTQKGRLIGYKDSAGNNKSAVIPKRDALVIHAAGKAGGQEAANKALNEVLKTEGNQLTSTTYNRVNPEGTGIVNWLGNSYERNTPFWWRYESMRMLKPNSSNVYLSREYNDRLHSRDNWVSRHIATNYDILNRDTNPWFPFLRSNKTTTSSGPVIQNAPAGLAEPQAVNASAGQANAATATPNRISFSQDDVPTGSANPAKPRIARTPGSRRSKRTENKKLYNDIVNGHFGNNKIDTTPGKIYLFHDSLGVLHTFRMVGESEGNIKWQHEWSAAESSPITQTFTTPINEFKRTLSNLILDIFRNPTSGHRSPISLPANIIRALQGTAYGWFKQGGRLDRLKIQLYKNYMKK